MVNWSLVDSIAISPFTNKQGEVVPCLEISAAASSRCCFGRQSTVKFAPSPAITISLVGLWVTITNSLEGLVSQWVGITDSHVRLVDGYYQLICGPMCGCYYLL